MIARVGEGSPPVDSQVSVTDVFSATVRTLGGCVVKVTSLGASYKKNKKQDRIITSTHIQLFSIITKLSHK